MQTRRHIKKARLVGDCGYSISSSLACCFLKTKCHSSNCNHQNTFLIENAFCGQPCLGWITYNHFVYGWQANKSKVVHLSDWRCIQITIIFILTVTYSFKVWHYRSWGGHVMAQTGRAALRLLRHHSSFDIKTMCSKSTITGHFLWFNLSQVYCWNRCPGVVKPQHISVK